MQAAWRQLQTYHTGICKKLKLDPREWKSMINKELRLPNGSIIQMRTAENPESLAGESVDGIVFDEFSMAREKVWTEQLAPTLITTGGWVCFIGVPKGNNWATKIWRWAKTEPGWNQLHFRTLDNPYITQKGYDDVAAAMPKTMQQQELEAAIIAGRGQVFSNILECTGAQWQECPRPGAIYTGGLDWARDNDYTVFTVVDATTRELVWYDRFNGLSYVDQAERIKNSAREWGCTRIISESNAMGAPLIDWLQRENLPIEAFDMNKTTKREIIELLVVAFENETFSIPSDETLIDELESMELNLTKTGHPQYGAPPGMHDDLVMSLALAHWGIAYRPRI